MDKKNNMKQAMFEMFGVGSDPAAKEPAPVKEEPKSKPAVAPAKKAPEKTPAAEPVKKPVTAVSYLAPGTVMEGTLRSDGNVEVSGEFKGDITTKGTVILRSSIQGNITANSLNLYGCSLTGDIVVTDVVSISQDSTVCGNVTAREVQCAGRITGDLKISENTALEGTAQINGGIITGSMSVAKGAVIRGGIEIKMTPPCEKTTVAAQPAKK